MAGRIQFHKLRALIDHKFLKKVGRLETCYYQNWKQGKGRWFVAKRDNTTREPLMAFNIRNGNPNLTRKVTRSTPQDSWSQTNLPLSPKDLFDKLHGMIWHRYTVAFKALNDTLSEAPEGASAEGFAPGRKGFYIDENGAEQICKIDGEHVPDTTAAEAGIAALQSEGVDTDGEEEDNDSEEVTV